MAKQDANPPSWDDSMSDGCSGVPNYGYGQVCITHDRAYHYGGTLEDKLVADGLFHKGMCDLPGFAGWFARAGFANIRYTGIRATTYNYPPGHEMRDEYSILFEAFNWLGNPEGKNR